MAKQPSLSDQAHQALASGAALGMARALARTSQPDTVEHFVETHLSDLPADDVSYIKQLGKQLLNAANILSSIDPEEDIPIEVIPVNPDLFGDDWAGKRIEWTGRWNLPGTDKWYTFRGDLPDVADTQDIYDAAGILASDYIEQYPKKFIPEGYDYTGQINVELLTIERKF